MKKNNFKNRLIGLAAAQKAIDEMILEARKATQPYGKRQKRSLEWWKGRFDGLVCGSAMLALADFPDIKENKEQIMKILNIKNF